MGQHGTKPRACAADVARKKCAISLVARAANLARVEGFGWGRKVFTLCRVTTRELLETGLANLRKLKDEVALEVHLGGMEAKDLWEQLEGKFRQLERDVGRKGEVIAENARETALNGIDEVEKGLKELRAKLGK